VLALWTAAHAITMEATLSFLGSGSSPSVPSLGRLIRDGQSGLLGGEWWIAGFPLIVVVVLIGLFAVTAEYTDGLIDPTRQSHV
jgi:peptide/nickel transport system permease protein